MRITVYTDEYLLMDTNIDNFKIINPKVTQEDNKVGSFTFTIYPDHPHFALITKMKSIITVYEEGQTEPLFRGRVYDEKQGFYNEKQVSCEGELAFLLDSVQRPWTFKGAPSELFTRFIAVHNSQVDASRQFTVGNITVTDPNDYITRSNSDYSSTWKEINDKLIKTLGGHLWVRHENGINYIDYLADFNVLSNQPIEFGKNLLDISKNVKVEGFATALIPLGAKIKDDEGNETEERLTIESVNAGVDYVYNEEAVSAYGYIFTTNTWDDVTDATNLKRKGQAYIDDAAHFVTSIEVSAADLNGATIDGEPVNVNSFRIGRYVKVNTQPHSIVNASFIISKLTRQLLKPEATKLTLGTTYKTLTEKQSQTVIGVVTGPAGQDGKDGKDGNPGKDGNDGRGILSTDIVYQASASGTAVPAGAWSETIPAVADNQYLWTKTVITYTDGTSSTSYAIGKMGAKGDKGDQGERGLQGLQGEKGEQGAAGANGKDAAVQSTTAPTDKSYMWLDISVEPPKLKRWNGESWVVVNDYSSAITMLEQRFTADIESTEHNFTRTLKESYYTKDDTNAIVSSASAEWNHTAQGFAMNFTNLEKELADVSNSADARFQEINSYIRYENGKIFLGRSDSPLILKIENDRISFTQNNTEVAYFSNNKLYVTDGEYTNSLQLGKFAFIPRSNGNLSFKKVVD